MKVNMYMGTKVLHSTTTSKTAQDPEEVFTIINLKRTWMSFSVYSTHHKKGQSRIY